MNILLTILIAFATFMSASSQDIAEVKADKLVAQYKEAKGVVVVNFWSTWCKPCIDEIPHFLDVYKKMQAKGVSLWLVSQDTEQLYKSGKLKEFVAKKAWNKVTLYWLNETNADYYCPIVDKSWSGVIPATVILNNDKGYYKFYEQSLTAAELEAAISLAL